MYGSRPEDFVYSENSFDFIVRRSEYIGNFAGDKNILFAQTIGGMYDLCYTDREYLPEIRKILGTNFIGSVSVLLGLQDTFHLDSAGITQIQYQPYLGLRGSGVIMGFIDTGIDYTLDIFRYEDGSSRIISIYDQSEKNYPPPEGFILGAEYDRAVINAALASGSPYDIVPVRDDSGHGTFLASVAAGRSRDYSDDFSGAAPDCEIIAVKLRKARDFYIERYAVSGDTENIYESNAVMLGAEYIINKARSLGRPVVICIGLGSNSGSHDGFGIFEEYLTEISRIRGVCICVSAGNECQARHHTQGLISEGDTRSIDIKVGGSRGNIYMNMWNHASDKLSVSVRSPTGEVVGRVPARSNLTITEKMVLEPSEVSIEYYYPTEGSGDQLTVIRVLQATPGIWSVTVYGDMVISGIYDAWLPVSGFLPKETEFLSADPYGTITVPAAAQGVICCGAYDHLNNSLYFRSSWGPVRTGRTAPDLTAPGVNITGYYPAGRGTMSGTSAAAAVTAGAAALLMQWGIVLRNDPSMSTYQIKTYLIRGCGRNENMIYPNDQWGYGTLDLLKSFYRLREM